MALKKREGKGGEGERGVGRERGVVRERGKGREVGWGGEVKRDVGRGKRIWGRENVRK